MQYLILLQYAAGCIYYTRYNTVQYAVRLCKTMQDINLYKIRRMAISHAISVPWPAQYYATHHTPRQSKMGATLVVALKLCGGRGVYEGRELAEFHEPRPRQHLQEGHGRDGRLGVKPWAPNVNQLVTHSGLLVSISVN